ncbi:MAG: hypothetical protein HUJ53_07110, partial [Holdemanella sp.]|nr:hypothetical protein [Holdemanella sp.]
MESLYKTKIYQNFRDMLISLIDVIIVFFSYGFVFLLNNNFFLDGRFLHFTKYIILAMVFVLVLHFIAGRLFKTQKSLWAYTGPSEVYRAAGCTLFCMIIMVCFSLYMGLFHISLIIMAELIAFVCCLGIRLLYRTYRRYAMHADRKQNALIIGAGAAGYIMLSEIYRNERYPYNVVGFLDDYKTKGTIISGKPVLGTIEEVSKIAKENKVTLARG